MPTAIGQPGQKAAERRTRVAIFGGTIGSAKGVGRRTNAGKKFNRFKNPIKIKPPVARSGGISVVEDDTEDD